MAALPTPRAKPQGRPSSTLRRRSHRCTFSLMACCGGGNPYGHPDLSDGTLVVGAYELNTTAPCGGPLGAPCCVTSPVNCCGMWWSNSCVESPQTPYGHEWEAANFASQLREAFEIATQVEGGKSGPYDVDKLLKMKQELDSDWTPRANKQLKGHGLCVVVHHFVTGTTPHLMLQFRKTGGSVDPLDMSRAGSPRGDVPKSYDASSLMNIYNTMEA